MSFNKLSNTNIPPPRYILKPGYDALIQSLRFSWCVDWVEFCDVDSEIRHRIVMVIFMAITKYLSRKVDRKQKEATASKEWMCNLYPFSWECKWCFNVLTYSTSIYTEELRRGYRPCQPDRGMRFSRSASRYAIVSTRYRLVNSIFWLCLQAHSEEIIHCDSDGELYGAILDALWWGCAVHPSLTRSVRLTTRE